MNLEGLNKQQQQAVLHGEGPCLVLAGAGSGKCVTGDTLIYTPDGLLEIGQAAGYHVVDPDAHECSVGVLSYTPDGTRAMRQASHWWDMGVHDILKLRTTSGYEIHGTPEHPILCLDTDGDLCFRKLVDVRPGDYAALSINNEVWSPHHQVSADAARVMGLLVADGYLSSPNGAVSFSNSDAAVIAEYKRLMSEVLGINEVVSRPRGNGTKTVDHRWHNAWAKNWLAQRGLRMVTAADKEIPWSVLRSHRDVVVAFLQAYFDLESNVNRSNIEVTTASLRLARQMQVVLLNFGIRAALSEKRVNGYEQSYWRLHISGRAMRVFREKIGYRLNAVAIGKLADACSRAENTNTEVIPHQSARLRRVRDTHYSGRPFWCGKSQSIAGAGSIADYLSGDRRPSAAKARQIVSYAPQDDRDVVYLQWLAENFIFEPTESVTPSTGSVYDFTVPGTHSFVSHGFISHNTYVLTKRTARLIKEGVRPERILLATFTKKAAEEMRTRLASMVGDERAQAVWAGTFHSHCLRMLKISLHETGQQPLDVLAPGQAMRLARDILAAPDDKHPYGMDWQADPKRVLSTISRAKADLVDVDRAERYLREKTELDDAVERYVEFWKRYELAKAEAKPKRLFDFDDFLLKTHGLFASRPDVLARWQSAFDYILEDEVQDTMIAQHEIVRYLAAEHRNYFCIGDIRQSIFGFRGSDPGHTVMSFERDYPEGEIIKLPTNYRSQALIVELGSRLIRHNPMPAAYSLEPDSARPAGKAPALFVSDDEDHEAEQIARSIGDSLLEGRTYRDTAVLYRVNAQSRALEDAMIRCGIPYVIWGSCGFYDRREVRDVLSFLQLAFDPSGDAGDEALRRVLNVPTKWFRLRGESKHTHFLGKAFLDQVDGLAHRRRCSMHEALFGGQWKQWQWDGVYDYRDFVDAVKRAGPRPQAMIAKAREVGYDEHLIREEGGDDDENDGSRLENLDELGHVASRFDNVGAFLAFVAQQRSRAKSLASSQDVVQLLTLHRSKGLEWPVVYLCGLGKGLLPHRRSIQYFDPLTKLHMIPESIEEERRLCYVGVTRAMDEVHISALLAYHDGNLAPSPFLTEMGFAVPKAYEGTDVPTLLSLIEGEG